MFVTALMFMEAFFNRKLQSVGLTPSVHGASRRSRNSCSVRLRKTLRPLSKPNAHSGMASNPLAFIPRLTSSFIAAHGLGVHCGPACLSIGKVRDAQCIEK